MINFLYGVLSGVFTGLGAGGGLFLIMLLELFSGFSQLEIQSINLIYYIPTAIFSIFVYSKEKNINYKAGGYFVTVGIISAIVGASLAHIIDIALLRKLFALYLMGCGIFLIAPQLKKYGITDS